MHVVQLHSICKDYWTRVYLPSANSKYPRDRPKAYTMKEVQHNQGMSSLYSFSNPNNSAVSQWIIATN